MTTIKEENNNLLNFILEQRFFNPWKEENFYNDKTLKNVSRLELYITPNCNQNCSYCYLQKYKKDLYPANLNNQDNIINNLKILLDWIISKDFYIPSIDLFSGEIWATDFGLQILQIILDYIKKGLKTQDIIIPTNCSFLLEDKYFYTIQNYIYLYKNNNVNLKFSLSVDGKEIENLNRPFNDSNIIKDDNFYEKCFAFAKHNNFLFHPMISAQNIDKWIKNYQWWKEMHLKNNLNVMDIMLLEVRNNDWNKNNIQEYLNFLDYLIDDILKEINKNDFFNSLIGKDNILGSGYIPYGLPEEQVHLGCTVTNTLTIRLGDLSICPCHRLSYNKLLYGKFNIENNQIKNIEAINPYLATRILFGNNKINHIKCDSCLYSSKCIQGCLGSQYENEDDPFIPIDNVCLLFKEKIKFLLKKYEQLGFIDFCMNISPYSPWYLRANEIINFYNILKENGEI